MDYLHRDKNAKSASLFIVKEKEFTFIERIYLSIYTYKFYV